jgi:hypothetical protein
VLADGLYPVTIRATVPDPQERVAQQVADLEPRDRQAHQATRRASDIVAK